MFAKMDKVPDCIPTNIREWDKFVDQIKGVMAYAENPHTNLILDAASDYEAFIRTILGGKEGYKKSVFEVLQDLRLRGKTKARLEAINNFKICGLDLKQLQKNITDVAKIYLAHHAGMGVDNENKRFSNHTYIAAFNSYISFIDRHIDQVLAKEGELPRAYFKPGVEEMMDDLVTIGTVENIKHRWSDIKQNHQDLKDGWAGLKASGRY